MNSSMLGLLAASALFFGGETLHLQPAEPQSESAEWARPDSELTHQEAEHLPALEQFKKDWSALGQKAEAVPIKPGITLVMAVFTSSKEVLYHSIIRTTWMTQPGVCKAAEGPREGCGVYVTFAQGSDSSSPESFYHEQRDNDTVFLPFEENMDNGKTRRYFLFAMAQYPWATHYGKMDTDVFPRWAPILRGLARIPHDCESYVGRPWICINSKSYCPPTECGPPQVSGELRWGNSSDSSCWSYMQGGLYIISRGLLAKASEPDGYWQYHDQGPEDARTGKAVLFTARQYNLCVYTFPQELAQLNVAYVHTVSNRVICDTPDWADYYQACGASKRERKSHLHRPGGHVRFPRVG